MLFRNCAGGVVFFGDKVLLIQNEKEEWVLPKGIIRSGNLSREVALHRVNEEAGVNARIISTAGETSYEFFSVGRRKPVCNQITWYLMEADSDACVIDKELGFLGGGFYPVDKAIKMITYSQDQTLVRLAFKKFEHLKKEV